MDPVHLVLQDVLSTNTWLEGRGVFFTPHETCHFTFHSSHSSRSIFLHFISNFVRFLFWKTHVYTVKLTQSACVRVERYIRWSALLCFWWVMGASSHTWSKENIDRKEKRPELLLPRRFAQHIPQVSLWHRCYENPKVLFLRICWKRRKW